MTAPIDARAFTVYPHWAHAVAHLGKRVENRARAIPAGMVGERVAVHAGALLPRGWQDDLGRHGISVWDDEMDAFGSPRGATGEGGDRRSIWTRGIVATAVLRDPDTRADEWRLARVMPGWGDPPLPAWADPEAAYWWALEDVITLDTPVPVQRGQLGLWRLTPAQVEAVGAAGGWG